MRAYDAEEQAFGPAWSVERVANAMDLHDARMLAQILCDEFGVSQIQVDRARSNARRSTFWYPYGTRPGRISLKATADPLVVCHEVAHHIAWEWGMPKGHGPEWATICLRAVYLTAEHDDYLTVTGADEDRLRQAFEAAGLLRPQEVER